MSVTVVWGPPASGKSTYVQENRSENSVTFDFDDIMQALSGLEAHMTNRALIGLALDVREAVFDALREGLDIDDSWIIVTNADDGFQAAIEDLDPEYVCMDTDKETCLRRIREDPNMDDDEMAEVVERWFETYGKRGDTMKNRFWEFKNKGEKTGELYLYGDISSSSWWGDEVTPQQFKDDLDGLGDVNQLHVYINSPGGDVFAGQSIHNMLKRHPAQVTVHVDGMAASIASVIAMAGDKIVMPTNAMMMIHPPWSMMAGTADDFVAMAEQLEKVQGTIESVYMDRTQALTQEQIHQMMADETWMSAEECLEYGFCDEVEAGKKIAASIRGDVLVVDGLQVDIKRFKSTPPVDAVEEEQKEQPDEQMEGNVYDAENFQRKLEEHQRLMNLYTWKSQQLERMINSES